MIRSLYDKFINWKVRLGKARAVCVVVTNDDGLILAVARRGTTDQFGLPGGKVDKGEFLEEAAIRETLEETGVTVSFLDYLYERIDDDFIVTTFFAHVRSDYTTLSGDAGPVKWVPWDTLLAGPFGQYNAKVKIAYQKKYPITPIVLKSIREDLKKNIQDKDFLSVVELLRNKYSIDIANDV